MAQAISKNVVLCVIALFLNQTAWAACYSIPNESSVSWPSSGTAFPTNGNMNSSTTYLVNSNVTVSSSVSSGTGGSIIYITNGATLTVTNDFNPDGTVKVYVQSGASLIINGNYNSSTTTVYGNLTTTGVSLQNGSANIYIASTGYWNASSAELNMSGGTVVIEGTAVINKLNQFQNSGTSFCVNKSGCAQFNQIAAGLTLQNSVFTDNGIGYIYWNNNSCPITSGYSLTTSSSLNVCSAQTSGTCAFWGAATVKYNCIPTAPANCSGAIALPIKLEYFKASYVSPTVQLDWATVSQIHSKSFVIEKSTNGESWEEVGTLPSKGDYMGHVAYRMTDNFPTEGYIYYRLKEIDINGNANVYAVSGVRVKLEEASFLLSPNPSSGIFNVSVGEEYEKYDLEIMDLNGRAVGHYILRPGNNSLTISNPGVYFAKLKVGRENQVQKFIVQ